MVPLSMRAMGRGRSLRDQSALGAKGIEGLEFVISIGICSAGASFVRKCSRLRYSPKLGPPLCAIHGDDGEEDRGKDCDENAGRE